MGLVKINFYPRTTSGKNENRRTRAAGHIPAIIYGKEREATKVQLDTVQFTRVLQKTGGRSVIFDLDLEGESENPLALMRELQQHPVTDEIRHVDLFEIPRGVPVTVEVALELQGEPQCVKFGEGEIIQTALTVELSCLPRELPESITVDVSELEMSDKLFVKDLEVPIGEVITDEETQILVVKAATIFAEEEEEEGEAVEGEEGEAAAEGDESEDKSEDA
jgi:large subunit ribosomal protein L25